MHSHYSILLSCFQGGDVLFCHNIINTYRSHLHNHGGYNDTEFLLSAKSYKNRNYINHGSFSFISQVL